MKKIIIALICFLSVPFIAKAANYDIVNYRIEANLLTNGNMEVKEYLVLDGTFNGYIRDIKYRNSLLPYYSPGNIDFSKSSIYNANDITDFSVSGKQISKIEDLQSYIDDFEKFESVDYASNGEKNKYILSTISDGYSLKMFYYTNNYKTVFLISYNVENAVVMHNDVAELYWNFIGNEFADKLNNVRITLYLPEKDNSSNFRIWAHGPVSGDINFIVNNNDKVGLEAKIDQNPAYSPIDIRTTFDKSLITNITGLRHSEQNALDEIIKVETIRANEANAQRADIRNTYNTFRAIGIIDTIVILLSWIYIYIKYDKERKPIFSIKYNREFIEDYNVEVIDYLMKRQITPSAMSASIMNMIYKKNITVEELNKKNNYQFTLMNREKLDDNENKLCDFLFDYVGSNNIFTSSDLKKKAGARSSCQDFINKYTSWKNGVFQKGKNENFFEKKHKAILWAVLILIINIMIFSYANTNLIEVSFVYIGLALSIAFMIYTVAFSKKTFKGIEHYTKWQAFRNFLNDFGNFKTKELPEIALWERYLVYAIIFGLASKVQKNMNVKFQEMGEVNNFPTSIFLYSALHNDLNRSVSQSIASARTAINAKNAASSNSSGGGFGGGFSSGGGFGGGGGGGHGF